MLQRCLNVFDRTQRLEDLGSHVLHWRRLAGLQEQSSEAQMLRRLGISIAVACGAMFWAARSTLSVTPPITNPLQGTVSSLTTTNLQVSTNTNGAIAIVDITQETTANAQTLSMLDDLNFALHENTQLEPLPRVLF